MEYTLGHFSIEFENRILNGILMEYTLGHFSIEFENRILNGILNGILSNVMERTK